MKNIHCCTGYPDDEMPKGLRARIALLQAMPGGLDPEEYEDVIKRYAERRNARKDAALKRAKAMLRQASHPVGRRDMLRAMEDAIEHQVNNFERMGTTPQAAALVALVICLNMLKDGPLHEGD